MSSQTVLQNCPFYKILLTTDSILKINFFCRENASWLSSYLFSSILFSRWSFLPPVTILQGFVLNSLIFLPLSDLIQFCLSFYSNNSQSEAAGLIFRLRNIFLPQTTFILYPLFQSVLSPVLYSSVDKPHVLLDVQHTN